MQLSDGRVANFILDARGTRNLSGVTSYPGGAWWTARALWARAVGYRVFGLRHPPDALQRCPIPAPERTGELKRRAELERCALATYADGVQVPTRPVYAPS
jgi:hypothetical protein